MDPTSAVATGEGQGDLIPLTAAGAPILVY